MTFFDRHIASSQPVLLGIVSAFIGLILQQLVMNALILLTLGYQTTWYAVGEYALLFLIQVSFAFFVLGHVQGNVLAGASAAALAAFLGFLLSNTQIFSAFLSVADSLAMMYLFFMLPQLVILTLGQFTGGFFVWVKSRQHAQVI
ncbi:MAG: hypothetical protein WC641_01455 [Patescibacteria group bacterium]